MSKKMSMKWLKPLKFSNDENHKMDTSENYHSISQTQQKTDSKKPSSKYKRSFSQNDLQIVDLTIDEDMNGDDSKIPRKKPKLLEPISRIDTIDIKKLLIPKTSSDLVIHPKKIQEVKGWFQECDRLKNIRKNPVLLVTGPCGSGKMTCVKVVAEENGYEVNEYVTDSNCFDKDQDKERNWEYMNEGQVKHFETFLRETTRYGTILKKAKNKKVIVCKDIPNIFLKNPQLFQNILQYYSKSGRAPLIFITNDSKGKQSNSNYKLFNDENMATYKIAQITFNPVSYMQLLKHLKIVATKMAEKPFREFYNVPSGETIESIMVSSQGDIRSATINLLFACQRGAIKMGTEKEGSKLTEKKQAKKYKNLGSDENVSMMHFLGKVLNPKYEQKDGIETLTNNPESLTDMFSSQANTCLKMIFVNYTSHFTKMQDAAMTADLLSASDVLVNEWRDDILPLYGLNVGIRGTMASNTEPVKGLKTTIRGFRNLFGKGSDSSYQRPTNKPLETIRVSDKTLSCNDLPHSVRVCDCLTFTNIIKNDPACQLLDIDDDMLGDDIYIIENFDDE